MNTPLLSSTRPRDPWPNSTMVSVSPSTLKSLSSALMAMLLSSFSVTKSCCASGGSDSPVTVTVTTADGQRYEGRLDRIDDFIVTLTQADGVPKTFRRNGDVPAVQITDPLDAHKKMLVKYTDKDMHDVTAYLVTLK